MTKATTPTVDETRAIPETVDATLATILCWPRPHGSGAETAFRDWLDSQIALRNNGLPPSALAEGCRYTVIKNTDGSQPTTLFSCHIDTVDVHAPNLYLVADTSGVSHVPQKSVVYDANFGYITLDNANKIGSCLGADDGIGIWLMLNMISARVPGGYIFHTGEERGGIGSRAVRRDDADILKLYEVAVAFDRPGTDEVITHQGRQECCSQKFALALSERLNKHGFAYKPSNRGVFTDTKIYRDVIAECTNLGVGYTQQHGNNETQDYGHACELRDAVCKIDWNSLPVDRDPKKPDAPYRGFADYSSYGRTNSAAASASYGRGSFRDEDDETDIQRARRSAMQPASTPPKAKPAPAKTGPKDIYDDLVNTTYDDLLSYIESFPDQAAADIVQLVMEIGRLRSDVAVLTSMSGMFDEVEGDTL